MPTFLNFFVSSFSQLLSLPSFTAMANKSVLSALDHCDISSFEYRGDFQSTLIGGADEKHPQRVELESSLKAPLLVLSHSRGISHSGVVPTPPAPANSPSLTPSNTFPDSHALVSAIVHGEHSTFPSFGPSISSTPTFDLSLINDSSDYPDEEPEEFFLSDYTSISSDVIQMPGDLSKGVGLGITGARKHDGSRPFDGVGLVSIRRCIPRSTHTTRGANVSVSHDLYDEGDAEISDTFLQEAAMTFIQDPFHIHSLATIPECQSWSELDLDESETSVGELEISLTPKVSISENDAPLGRMKKHFSASTISSELKRTSASTPRRMCPGGMRTRSSTWPSYARFK